MSIPAVDIEALPELPNYTGLFSSSVNPSSAVSASGDLLHQFIHAKALPATSTIELTASSTTPADDRAIPERTQPASPQAWLGSVELIDTRPMAWLRCVSHGPLHATIAAVHAADDGTPETSTSPGADTPCMPVDTTMDSALVHAWALHELGSDAASLLAASVLPGMAHSEQERGTAHRMLLRAAATCAARGHASAALRLASGLREAVLRRAAAAAQVWLMDGTPMGSAGSASGTETAVAASLSSPLYTQSWHELLQCAHGGARLPLQWTDQVRRAAFTASAGSARVVQVMQRRAGWAYAALDACTACTRRAGSSAVVSLGAGQHGQATTGSMLWTYAMPVRTAAGIHKVPVAHIANTNLGIRKALRALGIQFHMPLASRALAKRAGAAQVPPAARDWWWVDGTGQVPTPLRSAGAPAVSAVASLTAGAALARADVSSMAVLIGEHAVRQLAVALAADALGIGLVGPRGPATRLGLVYAPGTGSELTPAGSIAASSPFFGGIRSSCLPRPRGRIRAPAVDGTAPMTLHAAEHAGLVPPCVWPSLVQAFGSAHLLELITQYCTRLCIPRPARQLRMPPEERSEAAAWLASNLAAREEHQLAPSVTCSQFAPRRKPDPAALVHTHSGKPAMFASREAAAASQQASASLTVLCPLSAAVLHCIAHHESPAAEQTPQLAQPGPAIATPAPQRRLRVVSGIGAIAAAMEDEPEFADVAEDSPALADTSAMPGDHAIGVLQAQVKPCPLSSLAAHAAVIQRVLAHACQHLAQPGSAVQLAYPLLERATLRVHVGDARWLRACQVQCSGLTRPASDVRAQAAAAAKQALAEAAQPQENTGTLGGLFSAAQGPEAVRSVLHRVLSPSSIPSAPGRWAAVAAQLERAVRAALADMFQREPKLAAAALVAGGDEAVAVHSLAWRTLQPAAEECAACAAIVSRVAGAQSMPELGSTGELPEADMSASSDDDDDELVPASRYHPDALHWLPAGPAGSTLADLVTLLADADKAATPVDRGACRACEVSAWCLRGAIQGSADAAPPAWVRGRAMAALHGQPVYASPAAQAAARATAQVAAKLAIVVQAL